MIAYLKGTVLAKNPPKLLMVLENGVGYEVETPLSTFDRIAGDKPTAFLHTHLIPRDDALLLYGFLNTGERDLFRSLIKVNNVGPKLALSILSHMSTHEFASCINMQDHARLTNIPGLGKKTAERLVIEMKDRLKNIASLELETPSETSSQHSQFQEALNALLALGYKPPEAQRLLSKVDETCETVEDWIRFALKEKAI